MPHTRSFFLLIMLYFCAAPSPAQPLPGPGQPLYTEVPLGSIKPQGWLRQQLQTMNKGTTGHLDEVYDKLKNDNGWLGGAGDGWEETPYWLDGAVPLAYLLDDPNLKQKVLRYINWTLDNQRPSGYFGPFTKWEKETGNRITAENCDKGEDWWPKMIMLKVLQQYYSATNDARIIPFMTKYFQYQSQTLNKCKLGQWTEWAEARGMDNALIVLWLYNKTKEPFLPPLAEELFHQTFSWSDWLGNRDWVINAAAYQNDKHWMRRHGVNVGMGLKDPAVQYLRTNDKKYLDYLKTGFNDLMSLHGLPSGMYSADEDLHGNDPTQGTELCAIVEAQFSLEQTAAITGDVRYLDALEKMTFNALPTQTTDDYNTKQYYQIANQVQVSRGVFNFSLPFDNGMNNVFGMKSGYTCCLANMHQGWTKFASHLWYQTNNHGLAALSYSPCEISANVGMNNTPITIREVTEYPFEDQVRFEISLSQDVMFPLQFRIPAWCRQATLSLNGADLSRADGGNILTIERTWENGDVLVLRMPMTVTVTTWGKNSRAIERGPLVYALKLEEDWQKGHHEKEGDYFSVYPKKAWNYGLSEKAVKNPDDSFQVQTKKTIAGDFSWNIHHAPLEITTWAHRIPDWKILNGVAPQPVTDRNGVYKGKVSAKREKITLIPYGFTKLRVVAFPVVPDPN